MGMLIVKITDLMLQVHVVIKILIGGLWKIDIFKPNNLILIFNYFDFKSCLEFPIVWYDYSNKVEV